MTTDLFRGRELGPLAPHTRDSEPRPADASLALRPMRSEDAVACGQIGLEAHAAVSAAHNVPSEQPSLEYAVGMIQHLLTQPISHGFVAERDGQVLGSIFLHNFGSVAAIGPLTVHPRAEGGIGRQLMGEALAAARSGGLQRVRLVQSPAHLRSLALYATMGFDVQEPLVLVSGDLPPRAPAPAGVRPATEADLASCSALCARVHGLEREGEVRSAIQEGVATVAERDGRLVGYTTGLGIFGHAVTETTDDLQALIAAAPVIHGPGFFVPTRNTHLLRWLLGAGMRAVWPATLMTLGPYQPPAGAFLPSLAF
jgi:predicted N-acetyltransferase YhbS